MTQAVATTSAINSFREAILASRFDQLYGLAELPEQIEGQWFHSVTRRTDLDHPGKWLTVEQVFDQYAPRMADLSELLDRAMKHPNEQRKFPIRIVWKVEGQLWTACLDSSDPPSNGSYHSGRRAFGVRRVKPNEQLYHDSRILIRQ